MANLSREIYLHSITCDDARMMFPEEMQTLPQGQSSFYRWRFSFSARQLFKENRWKNGVSKRKVPQFMAQRKQMSTKYIFSFGSRWVADLLQYPVLYGLVLSRSFLRVTLLQSTAIYRR